MHWVQKPMPNLLSKTGGSNPFSDKAARQLIARAIRQSVKSREKIADELSERLRRRVTKHMLNGFTSEVEGKPRFPVACRAAESHSIQER